MRVFLQMLLHLLSRFIRSTPNLFVVVKTMLSVSCFLVQQHNFILTNCNQMTSHAAFEAQTNWRSSANHTDSVGTESTSRARRCGHSLGWRDTTRLVNDVQIQTDNSQDPCLHALDKTFMFTVRNRTLGCACNNFRRTRDEQPVINHLHSSLENIFGTTLCVW